MSYLGEHIPKLGFGLMRLPMLGEEVDLEQMTKMVDLFMAKGFTYFDTAYGYLGGKSEEAIKKTLVDRYPRESFKLATKLPPWAGAKTAEEARNMFWTSLSRTGAGYFDFYLMHNINHERVRLFDEYDLWTFVQEQKAAGLIKHLGFSVHDKPEFLDDLLKKHPEVEFVQLQINYADWENDFVQSRGCYEVARKHGKPIVIMEPIKGGSLATMPDSITSIFKEANPALSVSSWAIRFAASLEGIITVLSGMSTLAQMEDNVSYMEDFKPLTDEERKVIARVQDALDQIPRIPCTSCEYCTKGCPQQIPIPDLFRAMNNYLIYDNLPGAKGNYAFATSKKSKASACVECGQCESVCPQQIKIMEELKKVADLLE